MARQLDGLAPGAGPTGLREDPNRAEGGPPFKGRWRRPRMLQVGATPIHAVPFSSDRLGVWLVAYGTSLAKAGQTTTPGTGATIVQQASLPTGVYDVAVSTGFVGGTATAAADGTNWQLLLGGLAIEASFATPISNNQPAGRVVRVANQGTNSLTLAAINLGTTSVIYQGELCIKPLTPAYFGFDQLVNPGTESGGWPITDVWTYYETDQEIWIASPQANPVDVRLIEVLRKES